MVNRMPGRREPAGFQKTTAKKGRRCCTGVPRTDALKFRKLPAGRKTLRVFHATKSPIPRTAPQVWQCLAVAIRPTGYSLRNAQASGCSKSWFNHPSGRNQGEKNTATRYQMRQNVVMLLRDARTKLLLSTRVFSAAGLRRWALRSATDITTGERQLRPGRMMSAWIVV
jgi:hypothetical protein